MRKQQATAPLARLFGGSSYYCCYDKIKAGNPGAILIREGRKLCYRFVNIIKIIF